MMQISQISPRSYEGASYSTNKYQSTSPGKNNPVIFTTGPTDEPENKSSADYDSTKTLLTKGNERKMHLYKLTSPAVEVDKEDSPGVKQNIFD
jgi:glyoxylate carboligase